MCDTLGVFSPFEMQHPGLHFYYGTCHSNLSLFSSLQKVPPKNSRLFFAKLYSSPPKLQWCSFCYLYIRIELCEILEQRKRDKKLGTYATADVMQYLQSSREKLHLSITSFVSPPHNLGYYNPNFPRSFYHLKVTRTEESSRREKYVGETLI